MTLPAISSRSGRPLRRQRGTAYLVALLALVVLTIVGLGLAFITQTENQLASNERTLQRVFNAADTGLSAGLARSLANPGTAAFVLDLADPGVPSLPSLAASRERIEASPTFPILDATCNLCGVNNAGYAEGSYGSEGSFASKLTYALTATAVRQAGAAGSEVLLAEKTLAAMYDVEPWQSPIEAYQPLQDPAQLAKIRY